MQQRIELSSGVGSYSRELSSRVFAMREPSNLAVGRIMARKELGYAERTLCVLQ
jgi:hypothetical protein